MSYEYWMPHSHCVLYDKPTITLHVVGDICIALAYFLIPVALFLISWKYKYTYTKELKSLMRHGAAFIVNCGLTHVMDVWNWWHTNYVVEGVIVGLCAVVSLSFAYRIWSYLKAHPLRIDGELTSEEWYGDKKP